MKKMMLMMSRSRLDAILSVFVTVHPHETSALLHSSCCFFFILSAYFIVLPLRDEGAISLGLSNLPELFVGSLVLTLIVAPVSTLIFSVPNFSKGKALFLIHRFFSVSLLVFFFLWHSSSVGYLTFRFEVRAPSDFSCSFYILRLFIVSIFTGVFSNLQGSVMISANLKKEPEVGNKQSPTANSVGWSDHGWYYGSVRIGFFLWVALLNLITISSTWARVIDVMNSESGSRLFGFIGAGATLGQLFGSLFATGMAFMGPFLLLFAALLMELAAHSSKGINKDVSQLPEELSPMRKDDDQQNESDSQNSPAASDSSPKLCTSMVKPQLGAILDGVWLILTSTYLLYVSLFLWLSAVVSSFFYFQKVTVIAMSVTSSLDRRRLFAEINSFIAIFILIGQLTLTGRILSVAGVTAAICSAPFVAFSNLIALAIWPTWVAVALSETIRKVVTYVVTRPGRELLFTVVSQDEKYKAKVCIDVIVQRLGDASAAGMYKLLFSTLHGRTSSVCLYALPVCLFWMATAFHLGRRQEQLARLQCISIS